MTRKDIVRIIAARRQYRRALEKAGLKDLSFYASDMIHVSKEDLLVIAEVFKKWVSFSGTRGGYLSVERKVIVYGITFYAIDTE